MLRGLVASFLETLHVRRGPAVAPGRGKLQVPGHPVSLQRRGDESLPGAGGFVASCSSVAESGLYSQVFQRPPAAVAVPVGQADYSPP